MLRTDQTKRGSAERSKTLHSLLRKPRHTEICSVTHVVCFSTCAHVHTDTCTHVHTDTQMLYKSHGLHVEMFTLVPHAEGGEGKWEGKRDLGMKRNELQHIYNVLFY